MRNDYSRHILALDDKQLERFVDDWIRLKSKCYFEVERFSGSGDAGRDVVGFLSRKRHEGSWHNYQCKQYGKRLPTETAILEIGKLLYYAHQKYFLVPTQYYFVAPRGVNRNLERLIYNPSQFRDKLINSWDQYCSSKIIAGSIISLNDDLRKFISEFDFSTIKRLSLDEILRDDDIKFVLNDWFDEDIGPVPKRDKTPKRIMKVELPYITQLVIAYGQRCGKKFADHKEVENHPKYGIHLSVQRERFYDAEAFKCHYRDNTHSEVLKSFEKDIYCGIFETFSAEHKDSLARVDAVMTQASNVQVTGSLAKYAHVSVKQGVCHHFANEGNLKWCQ